MLTASGCRSDTVPPRLRRTPRRASSEALLNYLALLGWSIDGETTLFDRATLVSEFDLTRVSKSPAVWDPEKLEWMNGSYIRELPAEEFAGLIIERVAQAGLVDAQRPAVGSSGSPSSPHFSPNV